MNRREFLKVAGVTTAVTGAALATKPKKAFALELGEEHDQFPLEVTKDFKGFNQKNHAFMRGFWDERPFDDEHILKTYDHHTLIEAGLIFGAKQEGIMPNEDESKLGYRQLDYALMNASWSVNDHFATGSQLGLRNTLVQTHPVNPETGEEMKDMPVFVPSLYSWDNSKVDKMLAHGKKQYKFKDAQEAAKHIKKATKHFGADLVGIAPYERAKRWTYTEWARPNVRSFTMPDDTVEYLPFDPFKLHKGEYETFGVTAVKSDFKREAGFEPKSVIVLAFEMDYNGIKAAPTLVESASAGVMYSKMAETAHKLAKFLRNLGYKAAPCGNDTALSVPLAIEAGLGETSRMGMVVTEKYGPRVRLCKVYTDLEIHPDKPITFGVKEFCDVCMKCADACPSKSICHEPAQVIKEGMEFSTGKVNESTMTGVEKWFINGERCLAFWAYNGGDCGTCIAVCPYNKIDEWHHDLSKVMTLTPFKPLLRSMDEWFGYGGPVEADVRLESKYLKDAINDFWDKI
ncbi:reductive dehalogenase [Anaeromicrobium sediminis]|uniref:Reductive dehalogenase n=1 Tax=Anaeromicrobium sediminis TaxID=1478221 RepID=A0A267M7V5_9FIRM|nr:reductive dehalogenase [Anaeromicrobium sediminis]PAB55691.1 reductive dehalogenase [Anaeromicrobium sediminis]